MKKTYEIEVYGYGAEIIMGTLTDDQYDFWIPYADKESEALHSHLFWDSTSEEGVVAADCVPFCVAATRDLEVDFLRRVVDFLMVVVFTGSCCFVCVE